METVSPTNLLGLDRHGLQQFFAALGEKPFRAGQMMKWIHQRGVTDFDAMTDLSKALRARLADRGEVAIPDVALDRVSRDGTRKWLIRVGGGNCIETVFIPERDRNTLCISSQVGCALDCTFCATARQGFNRNLTTAEIVGQVWVAVQALGERRISNVVFMGMGEPLTNFDNVVRAIDILLDDFAFGISKRRVTLSTTGVVPALDRLGDVTDVSLAVSLHAPEDSLRNRLVPLNRKYPLVELLGACRRYLAKQPGKRRITWEYVMIDGLNDREDQARALVKLIGGIPSKVNLIPFNTFPGAEYRRSPDARIDRFREILIDAGLTAVTRRTRGDDIDAACGQLAGRVQDRSRRGEHMMRIQARV